MAKIKNNQADSLGLLLRNKNSFINESKNRCKDCNHQLFKLTDDGSLEIKCRKCKTINKYNDFDLLNTNNKK